MKIIVVGGGHSGIEAANIISRMGGCVLLITKSINNIGEISCNPSIGGVGKSHLVREIDSLGGIIGYISTKSSIQLKKINNSKGEAVYCTRSQICRNKYKIISNKIINNKNISIIQDEVEKIIIKKNSIIGVKTKNCFYNSSTVIITVGTFLRSKIYIGLNCLEEGRINEKNSKNLSKQLNLLIDKSKKLKTGTPPRISRRNVDLKNFKIQKGDFNPIPSLSSWYNKKKMNKPKDCWKTKTSLNTKELVLKSLKKSPIYSNLINGTSPRYCPSIEDKVYKFYKKNTHNIFLEPDNNEEFYLNGISTSLPFIEQKKIINSIKGLENAELKRVGYAVEYDFFNPKNLKMSLETKNIKGLFFAGQINGTTGYEEAAAQGIIAGINSFLYQSNKKFWYPNKKNSYIGIMINELIKNGVTEPYRMFTNKNKNKFTIREENSDKRLKRVSLKLGIKNRKNLIFEKNINKKIKNFFIDKIIFIKKIKKQIKIYFKYKNYIKFQINKKIKKNEILKLDKILKSKEINYFNIKNLSKEISENLNSKKPKNLIDLNKNKILNNNSFLIILKYLKNLN